MMAIRNRVIHSTKGINEIQSNHPPERLGRYFIFTTPMDPIRFVDLLKTLSISGRDVIYINFGDTPLASFEKQLPSGAKLYDLRKYDQKTLENEAAAQGYEVVIKD